MKTTGKSDAKPSATTSKPDSAKAISKATDKKQAAQPVSKRSDDKK